MSRRLRIGGPLAALALTLAAGPGWAQNRAAQLRVRWEQTPDAVRKAKLMKQLGDAEFRDIDREDAAGDSPATLGGLRQYRDEMRRSLKELDARGSNAEKHPAGFKELQISTRESLRRTNEIIVGLTTDEQGPFLDVRKDIEEMNRHLIRELFPLQPIDGEAPGKAK